MRSSSVSAIRRICREYRLLFFPLNRSVRAYRIAARNAKAAQKSRRHAQAIAKRRGDVSSRSETLARRATIVIIISVFAIAAYGLANAYSEGPRVILEIAIPPQKLRALDPKEIQCARNAVFGESRGQPVPAQVAVAMTIINRALSDKWPNDLCAVVKQEGQFAGYHASVVIDSAMTAEEWDQARNAVEFAAENYYELESYSRRLFYFRTAAPAHIWRIANGYIGTIGGLDFYE